MTRWLFDDQPQMVGAVYHAYSVDAASGARDALVAAFAAIDREALIGKAAALGVCEGRHPVCKHGRSVAEDVLVAAGVIPERES